MVVNSGKVDVIVHILSIVSDQDIYDYWELKVSALCRGCCAVMACVGRSPSEGVLCLWNKDGVPENEH